MTATSEAPSNDDADLPLGGVVEEIEAGTKKPGLIKSMPWLVRIAAVWLLLVFIAAASTTIFGWFGRDAPFLTDPNYNHFIFEGKEANQGPSGEFWLGTDKLARDIFSRIVAGAKVSITVALTAVAFGIVFGGMLGSLVGLVRGRTETVIMSLVDVILAFPGLILLLVMVSITRTRSRSRIKVSHSLNRGASSK